MTILPLVRLRKPETLAGSVVSNLVEYKLQIGQEGRKNVKVSFYQDKRTSAAIMGNVFKRNNLTGIF